MWKVLRSTNYQAGIFSKNLASPGPSDGILKVLSHNQCRTVIIEEGYIDLDFKDEFRTYYSKLFRSLPKRCERVHFFSSEAIPMRSLDQSGALQIPDMTKVSDEEYLGYSILRPTTFNRVGRTILRPPVSSNLNFCTAKYDAHILGRRFTFRGMPFIQQDSQAGACVHATLWMVARYYSSRFNLRPICISEINRLAKLLLPSGKAQTDKGAYIYQLIGAVEDLGFSCAVQDERSCKFWTQRFINKNIDEKQIVNFLANLLRPYLESSLPVFFTTSDHAYPVVGFHAQEPKSPLDSSVSYFIAHDDNRGPYQEVKVEALLKDVERVVVSVPPGVNLFAERVEDHLREFLMALPRHQALKGHLKMDDCDRLVKLFPRLRYRSLLVASITVQNALMRHLKSDLPVFNCLYAMDYPKFLWVTDLIESETGNVVGFSIVDSTATPKDKFIILALHYGPIFYSCDVQSSESHLQVGPQHGGILDKILPLIKTGDWI